MFYSHEILTSRKYGVATVWLVATLGQKSSLKRINRKQILEVNVPKACQTIVDPAAHMALRLQGNLLYGVSRVYLQQCGYILSDAQNAQNELQMMLRTVRDAALDPNAGKARPEQLILQDDPSFLPSFALPPPELLAELDSNFNFNADIVHSGESQSLTPFGSQQSQSSSHVGAIGGLILPTSSPGLPGEFRLEGGSEPGGFGGPNLVLKDDDMVEIEDPDFMFGDDGEIIQLSPGRRSARTPTRSTGAPVSGDAGASARMRREHKEGQRAVSQFPDEQVDIGLPIYNDGFPENETTSSDAPQKSSKQSEVVESSESFSAPLHRHRAARTIPTDAAIELRNKELADWNTNYRANMKAAARQKLQYRATAQAKKNAEHYVWGSGIGGIGHRNFGPGPNPLDMFFGDGLFESITGLSRKKVVRAKHHRDSGIDETTQEESRRVRQRTDEPETGRGDEDDGFFMPSGDAAVELPREAASALDDQQIFSAMPWNMSASIRGSSAIPRSGRVGMTGSAEQSRPGSRLVSASPLHGRGQPSAFDALRNLTGDADFGGDEFGLPGYSSDLPQPTAAPEISIRVQEALSTEGANFVTFMNECIIEKRIRAQTDTDLMSDILLADAAADIEEITFEELLPAAEHTKTIACQGLMMVLALGSKGMLEVQQLEHLGEISLKLTDMAKAVQVVEIRDGEESDEEESIGEDEDHAKDEALDLQEVQGQDMEVDIVMQEVEGHFQEQFSAGHAVGGEDESNSLHDD